MKIMRFFKTDIDGVVIIEPSVFTDARGYFFESYNEKEFFENGITSRFIQDNQSESCYGVIRGLHCQRGSYAQAKLVRVLYGKVLDVAVDIRPGSSTFGKYVSVELSDVNKLQLFIPKGFLHGFSVLSKKAVFMYKVDALYCKESEYGVRFDDPDIGVDWKIPSADITVADKDKIARSFRECF